LEEHRVEAGKARVSDRIALFISHATPEDSPFTIWLGAKLSALGYEVWADVLKLRGGEDWQRKLELALRNRALKVLLVANPVSVEKQGVRNEIQIATEVARALKDDAFIIPLRLQPYQSPFLIAQAQYIDFERGWAPGLRELLTLLEEQKFPRSPEANVTLWRELHTEHARTLVQSPELLTSNWLSIQRLPARIYYRPESEMYQYLGTYAEIPYGSGSLSFAPTQTSASESAPLAMDLDVLLKTGWPALGIQFYDARKLVTQLINVSLGNYFRLRGLGVYVMANRREAFWVPHNAPSSRIAFQWPGFTGSRQLQGRSLKRGVYWHFAVSPSFQTIPKPHLRLVNRLIFTTDGSSPITSSLKMHQLRRSFAKGWRNARWRDMLLAFLYWLSEGSNLLTIPSGPTEGIIVRLPPLVFRSPVSILATTEQDEVDEDDPTPDSEEDFLEDDTDE
jgi:hypothetical protein